MEDLSLSSVLYNKEAINIAIDDFSEICKISCVEKDNFFNLTIELLEKTQDSKDKVIDELCNYILGLMSN